MRVVKGLVKGPFKNEAAFKAAVLKVWEKTLARFTHFQIENEEKEPGMPDILSISSVSPAYFTEFKVSNKDGVIRFESTQPAFYKRNEHLDISILAWDVPRQRVVEITPEEVIAQKSLSLKIPEETNEVD